MHSFGSAATPGRWGIPRSPHLSNPGIIPGIHGGAIQGRVWFVYDIADEVDVPRHEPGMGRSSINRRSFHASSYIVCNR